MATQKQIDANRRNAQMSTRPITEAGKAVAKFNALRHGTTAESAVLPYDDWPLVRARRVETSTSKLDIQALKQRNGINPAPDANDDDNMRNHERYHGPLERSCFRAVETLRKIQNDRIREERPSTADRRTSGFVPRQEAQTVVLPEAEPTYANPCPMFPELEQETYTLISTRRI